MISSFDSPPIEDVVDLSVVFITYNRSHLLVQSIGSLRDVLDASGYFYELLIADDCSDAEHADRIRCVAGAPIARTIRNSGLGANANNVIANCRGRLILQLQDDSEWVGEIEILAVALELIDGSPDVGILQLAQAGTHLPVSRRECRELAFHVFKNDHIPWMRGCGLRPYSDQPHIERREFVRDVAAYAENAPMSICENNYKHRGSSQSRWKVAMIGAGSLFSHLGATVSFNPGGWRHRLSRLMHRLPGGPTLVGPTLRTLLRQMDHLAARLMAK